MAKIIAPGTTSLSLIISIVDDSGLPVTGLASATFPTTQYVRAGSAAATITTSDLAAVTSAYSSGGVKEIASGRYRLDLPDAAIATACPSIDIYGEASGKRIVCEQIQCGYVKAQTETGGTLLSTTQWTNARAGYLDNINNANLLNVPSSPAAVGSAMTLTSGERDSISTDLLDLANGVETGKTVRQALRIIAAGIAGKRSNAGTTTEQYDAIGAPGTARIVGNLDSSGNGTPTLTP